MADDDEFHMFLILLLLTNNAAAVAAAHNIASEPCAPASRLEADSKKNTRLTQKKIFCLNLLFTDS